MLVEAEFTSSQRSDRKNRRRRKKISSTGMMQPAVQRLFETCREVFSGPGTVPPPEDVLRLKSVLDTVTASDVGLNPNIQRFRHGNRTEQPPIKYLHLYECDKFSIGIFCLPPSGVIPLHNHPGMTVFSKLLFGSMHVKSYDWIDMPEGRQPGAPRLASVKSDNVIVAPCDTSVLYPNEGGNMHRFTAHGPCAVLDVLGPPYSDDRHCTYYSDFSVSSVLGDVGIQESSNGYAWLEEIDKPNDFVVVGAPYRGPRIIEH